MIRDKPENQPTSREPELNILSLNLHKGVSQFHRRYVLHEIRDAIRATEADIVFLQEVLGEHLEYQQRFPEWPRQSQYEFLADSIWNEFAYGRNAVYSSGHHGNAILSKFPIKHYGNHDISIERDERRGLLYASLTLVGQATDLFVICVHLSLAERHRRVQLQSLRDFIVNDVPAGTATIIAGDFNDWRGLAHHALYDLGFSEAFSETNGASARTFPAWFPLLQLDRIYFRGLTVKGTERLGGRPWSRLSDHTAIAAQLTLED